jgi:hypothetical protein
MLAELGLTEVVRHLRQITWSCVRIAPVFPSTQWAAHEELFSPEIKVTNNNYF